MFPFSSLLAGRSQLLYLPFISMTVNGGWTAAAYAGFRMDTDNTLYSRRKQVYTPITNSWIHEDSKGLTDASEFEVRLFNIDQSAIGQGTFNGREDELWYAITSDQHTWLFIFGTEFGPFMSSTVTGEFSIREIADPANIAHGSFSFTVTYEGMS